MIEYKVSKFLSWLFSTISNSAVSRKTQPPDSHQLKPLPWVSLLTQQLWTIQATAGATVERQKELQQSNRHSVGRVRCSYWLRYNFSMLEYKDINYLPWLFSTMLNFAKERRTHASDSHRWKPSPWFCHLNNNHGQSKRHQEKHWCDRRSDSRSDRRSVGIV